MNITKYIVVIVGWKHLSSVTMLKYLSDESKEVCIYYNPHYERNI